MEEALRAFLRALREERHMAENTLLSYERDLKKLFAWFRQEGVTSLSTVSELRLNSYLLWLEREGFSAATINRAAASIRAFFAYETAGGRYPTSPVFSEMSSETRSPVAQRSPSIARSRSCFALLPSVSRRKL